MKKQKIYCVVIDRNAEVTASLEAALRSMEMVPSMERVASLPQLLPVLGEHKPHIIFCPQVKPEGVTALMETVQRHSPDTLLVWVSREEWHGLTTWLSGVETCTVPLSDTDCFSQYINFLVHYAVAKHQFRQCKHLLGVAELRCHWLVDYSWEPIAYISHGMHLYANNAYLTLFGFESIAEVRSTPSIQLVEPDERKLFQALGKAADTGNRPSNRLLTSLRTLDGEHLRAEIRFIPAVLKGKRCYQLHVRPLEKHVKATPAAVNNHWDRLPEKPAITQSHVPHPAVVPQAKVELVAPVAAKPRINGATAAVTPLEGMQTAFPAAVKLRKNIPPMYFAEPSLQIKPDKILPYPLLLRQLSDPAARFRLDYWNVAQALSKATSVNAQHASNYLIFVSVGWGIFDNEGWRKRLLALLAAVPVAARRVVLGIPYEECLVDIRQFNKVATLLRKTGVQLALEDINDDNNRLIKVVKAIKPAFVRLSAEMSAKIVRQPADLRQLQMITKQLVDAGTLVIVSGVKDAATLNLVGTTAAMYAHGSIIKQAKAG